MVATNERNERTNRSFVLYTLDPLFALTYQFILLVVSRRFESNRIDSIQSSGFNFPAAISASSSPRHRRVRLLNAGNRSID
ncbi:hypothetical protein DFH28DRAFT_1117805 [Melampsora americana]|nr:hypothetical protein DFH28DRAFT_1117805 [Melampsora americana]